MMRKKQRPDSATAPARTGSLAERLVLIFLVAATLVLSYVYLRVVPERYDAPEEAFDLVNPMLDAEIGECVEVESTNQPQTVACVRVRKPGVVLRPRYGPKQMGIYRELRRSRPYLPCGVRYLPPRKSCADPGGGREDIELFDLNGFGMPYGVEVMLDAIRPAWVQLGGRNVFVYEVQMRQYGRLAGRTWYMHLHPDAPVTGNVLRRHGTDRGEVHWTIFTKATDCR